MKVYQAGLDYNFFVDIFLKAGGENGLTTYYVQGFRSGDKGWNKNRPVYKPIKSLFMDCGAYSAWTRGQVIDIHDYAKFIKKNLDYIDIYPNLDVKGDTDKTQENLKIMEDIYGLKPLPVYHLNTERWEILEDYIEKYDYIAVGAIAGEKSSKSALRNRLNRMFQMAKKDPLTKFHGFGLTSAQILTKYPFYSVDSTSWLSANKYGGMLDFNGKKVVKINNDYIKFLRTRRGYRDILRMGIEHTLQYEKYLTELWKRRGIYWE